MKIENTVKRKPKAEIKFTCALTDEQKNAKEIILNFPFTFLHGQAGTGKTLVACKVALELFFKREVDKIVVTRPTVGTEDNGFLPGTFESKLEPWLVPLRDNFKKVYNYPDKLLKMEHAHEIEIVALTHFRGRTFENSICIIDEYQNLTCEQLKMCIGRLGKGSKMIFCGDPNQIDLKKKEYSGSSLITKIENTEYVGVCELIENHRHPAVLHILNILK